MKKIILLIMLVLIVPLANAGNYIFQNTTGANLTKIDGSSGDLTVIGIGFFKHLGSITNRITNIFTSYLNVSGNVDIGQNISVGTGDTVLELYGNGQLVFDTKGKLANFTNNVSALYFIGDGSLLTNLPGGSGDNSSWNQSFANTLYTSIIWNYNQTTPANSYTDTVISNNNASWITTYNITYNNILNQLCPAGKVVNGTLANGTFICTTPTAVETDPIFIAENSSLWTEAKNKYNVTYATFSYNQTTPANSYTDTKTGTNNLHLHNLLNITGTDDNACSGTDKVINVTIKDGNLQIVCGTDLTGSGSSGGWTNDSINTNTSLNVNVQEGNNVTANWFKGMFNWVPGDIYSLFNGTTLTFTTSATQWFYNQTIPANSYTDTVISNNNASWITTYNITYNNILNQLCPAGKVVNGTLANGTFICTTPTAVETDPIFIAENSSLWTEAKNKYNVTYATFSYNQTLPAQTYTDNNFLKLTGGQLTGNLNISSNGNISIMNNSRIYYDNGVNTYTTYNGTCLNTYIKNTLVMSIGCE